MVDTRYVGIGKESVYGTAVAATRYIETVEKINPDQGWIIPKPVANRTYRKKNLGFFKSQGSLGPFDVEPENIGEIILGALGSVTSAQQGGTAAYKHNFRPADTLASWTLRLGVDLKQRILPGSLIDALTLRFAHGENLKASVEVFARGPESHAAIGTPTLSALQAFVYHQAAGLITIAGSEKSSQIYDGEIKIANNLPKRGDLGSRYARKLLGDRVVTGKLSVYFDDTVQYDAFLNGTEFALAMQFDGPLITGSYKYLIYWTLPKCVYLRDAAPHIPDSITEPIVIDAPFQAFYDSVNGFEVGIDLQNTITTY